jgi:hypothetical protein
MPLFLLKVWIICDLYAIFGVYGFMVINQLFYINKHTKKYMYVYLWIQETTLRYELCFQNAVYSTKSTVENLTNGVPKGVLTMKCNSSW